MALPLSVTKFRRHSGLPPSLVSSRATYERAIGITSTGSGNLPSTSTSFDWSAMHTNLRATAVTIFSRVNAPPPPLIMARWRVTSSAPSTYTGSSSTPFRSNTGMPSSLRRPAVASELATAPLMRCLILPSSVMKKLAVEPLPTPTTQSSGT